MTFEKWYKETLHHEPDVNSGIGATMKMQWDYQQKKIDKLKELLLEVGETTHRCKRLHAWYCENSKD